MRMAGSFLLVVLSLGVAGYALVGYGLLPPGELVHPDMKAAFASDAAAIRLHAFAAALALILGQIGRAHV